MISTGPALPWPGDAIVLVSREPVAGSIGLATPLDDGIAGYVELAQPDTLAHLVIRASGQADAAQLERIVGQQAARRLARLSAESPPVAAGPQVMRLPTAELPMWDALLRLAQVEMIRRWLQIDLEEHLLDLDLLAARCEANRRGRLGPAPGVDLAIAVEYGSRVIASADDEVPAPQTLILEVLRMIKVLQPLGEGPAVDSLDRVRSRLRALAAKEARGPGRLRGALEFPAPCAAGRGAIRFPLRRRDLPSRVLRFGPESEVAVSPSSKLVDVFVPAFPGALDRAGAAELVVRLVDTRSRLDLAWAELVPDASGTQFRATLAPANTSSRSIADGSFVAEILREQDADTPWEPPDLPQLRADDAVLDAFAYLRAAVAAHAVGDGSWVERVTLAGSCLSISNRDFSSAQRAQLHQMREFRQRVAAGLHASTVGSGWQRQGHTGQPSEGAAFATGAPWRDSAATDPGPGRSGWPMARPSAGLSASLRPTLAELDAWWTAARGCC